MVLCTTRKSTVLGRDDSPEARRAVLAWDWHHGVLRAVVLFAGNGCTCVWSSIECPPPPAVLAQCIYLYLPFKKFPFLFTCYSCTYCALQNELFSSVEKGHQCNATTVAAFTLSAEEAEAERFPQAERYYPRVGDEVFGPDTVIPSVASALLLLQESKRLDYAASSAPAARSSPSGRDTVSKADNENDNNRYLSSALHLKMNEVEVGRNGSSGDSNCSGSTFHKPYFIVWYVTP